MLSRTHSIFGLFLALIFLPIVSNMWVFVPIVLISSLLPDIDIAYSYLGKKKIFRPLQFFVKHRGVIHSLTIGVLLSLLFSFYLPIVAFPMFLGYAGHLFLDSLTVDGIRPFWPSRKEVSGRIRVGGSIEWGLFIIFVFVNVFIILSWFI